VRTKLVYVISKLGIVKTKLGNVETKLGYVKTKLRNVKMSARVKRATPADGPLTRARTRAAAFEAPDAWPKWHLVAHSSC